MSILYCFSSIIQPKHYRVPASQMREKAVSHLSFINTHTHPRLWCMRNFQLLSELRSDQVSSCVTCSVSARGRLPLGWSMWSTRWRPGPRNTNHFWTDYKRTSRLCLRNLPLRWVSEHCFTHSLVKCFGQVSPYGPWSKVVHYIGNRVLFASV